MSKSHQMLKPKDQAGFGKTGFSKPPMEAGRIDWQAAEGIIVKGTISSCRAGDCEEESGSFCVEELPRLITMKHLREQPQI